MDAPPLPPLPPPPLTTTNVQAEIELPTHVQPSRMGNHPAQPLSTNGLQAFKSYHAPPIASPYGKCNKNYATNSSNYVVDGCGEFMPSYNFPQSDPKFYNCAACGCHRSFHIEPCQNHQPVHHAIEYRYPSLHHPQTSNTPTSPLSPTPISSSYVTTLPHMTHALNQGLPPQPTNQNGAKRFRSKFTKDQKGKMQEFAEKFGWKMKKADEENILKFCNDIGINRGVFKIWMHNNKSKSVKKNSPEKGGNSSSS